eukprot:2196114-Amphidinium_carterae.1
MPSKWFSKPVVRSSLALDAELIKESHDVVCARLGLTWASPKPNCGAGRPSSQKLYEAELYKCLQDCEWHILEKVHSSQVPLWWQPGQ